MLYHNGNPTYKLIGSISETTNINKSTLNVVNLLAGTNYGITSLKGLPIGSSIDDCLKKYGQPNKIEIDDEKVYWLYIDNDCKLNIVFENNLLVMVSGCGFITEEIENE